MTRPPLKPRVSSEPFVGYADTPSVDRRFLLGLSVLGIAGLGGLGWTIAKHQADAGRGAWDMGTPVTLAGSVAAAPYAHIRVVEDGAVRTVLLGCETKCGARERLEEIAFDAGGARVRGTLLERGNYQMLATSSAPDWIEPDASLAAPPEPVTEDLGEAEMAGEILDTKCWFGAMRPNEGLSHKACAMLCIASGVAPYFGVRDTNGRERALMITDPDGGALVQPILEFVAEPVRASGRLVRIDDLIQFRLDPASLRRA